MDKLANAHDHDRLELLRLLVRVPSDRVIWATESVRPLTEEPNDELRNLAQKVLAGTSHPEE